MITLVHPHFSYPGHVKAKSSIKTTLKRVIFRRKKKNVQTKIVADFGHKAIGFNATFSFFRVLY